MSCWIPGPWAAAWGVKSKRRKPAVATVEVPDKVEAPAPKRRGRPRKATAPAETEQCPIKPPKEPTKQAA